MDIIYGAIGKLYLKYLDTIDHQGISLALVAFWTSPVQTLYVEASYSSLYWTFSLNHIFKMTSLQLDLHHGDWIPFYATEPH